MKSARFAGTTIELGSQWMFTGVDPTADEPSNIMYQLARQCGLQFREQPIGGPPTGWRVYDSDGANVTEEANRAFDTVTSALASSFGLLQQILQEGSRDISFEIGLRLNGWRPRTPVELNTDWFVHEVLAGQVEPPAGTSFVRVLPILLGGGTLFLVTDERGFAHIPECLANEFLSPNDSRLHLNTRVSAIQWSDECVCATAFENGETRQYCAPYAILTFSIGSLQFGTVQFDPELPSSKVFNINEQNMDNFLKIFLVFNETFWDTDVDWIAYVDRNNGREYYPLFSPLGALLPGKLPILQAFLTGETALRVAQQNIENSKRQIMESLHCIYGDRVTEPVDIIHDDFITNPHFYGHFTSTPVGVNDQSYVNLAAPLGRLYFSGEATAGPIHGIVQGGYFSGLATANTVIQDIQQGTDNILIASHSRFTHDDHLPLFRSPTPWCAVHQWLSEGCWQ